MFDRKTFWWLCLSRARCCPRLHSPSLCRVSMWLDKPAVSLGEFRNHGFLWDLSRKIIGVTMKIRCITMKPGGYIYIHPWLYKWLSRGMVIYIHIHRWLYIYIYKNSMNNHPWWCHTSISRWVGWTPPHWGVHLTGGPLSRGKKTDPIGVPDPFKHGKSLG